jgi:type II restriction enzyme
LQKEKTSFELLENQLTNIDKPKFLTLLLECGVIPEVFIHDSTEEKLWAKYSDILLSKSFEFLGLKSQVIRVRGDSADVLAESPSYKIVGDAKTFRLSRTAKNQKDFKVEALDSWRRSNDYAMFAGPLNQFPNTSSAIYRQAILKNVTLLSYSHLHFMVKFNTSKMDCTELWKIGKSLERQCSQNELRSAEIYWRAIDEVVLRICKKKKQDLEEVKKLDRHHTRELGNEGIRYWESKIEEYKEMSREEAIRQLLKAEKIEAKIEQIKKAIAWEVV